MTQENTPEDDGKAAIDVMDALANIAKEVEVSNEIMEIIDGLSNDTFQELRKLNPEIIELTKTVMDNDERVIMLVGVGMQLFMNACDALLDANPAIGNGRRIEEARSIVFAAFTKVMINTMDNKDSKETKQ